MIPNRAEDPFGVKGDRQTPRPAPFPAEAGKPFEEVVRIRQAALEARPAIKAAYFAGSNPILQYGLPTRSVALTRTRSAGRPSLGSPANANV